MGTELHAFAQRAGFYMGEINAIHPFRDGNGRAQRDFIRGLGVQAGFVIDCTKVTPELMMAASTDSFVTGDSSGLAALIQLCMKRTS